MATGDGEEETTSQRSESLWKNILYIYFMLQLETLIR